jgi:pyridoxamine 5'-phosphate oxidase
MEDLKNYINSIRRDFAGKPLNEDDLPQDPYQVFEIWFEQAVQSQILDPYAMIVSTVGKSLVPSTRVVYMRDISLNGLVFYTNYNSQKGKDLEQNPYISVLFFWGELERQVRIEGKVEKLAPEKSDAYFASRPRESCIGAWASSQSNKIKSRAELEQKVKEIEEKFKETAIPRPQNWGGYLIKPFSFEFWQGRPNRLHDRIKYNLNPSEEWEISRLSP